MNNSVQGNLLELEALYELIELSYAPKINYILSDKVIAMYVGDKVQVDISNWHGHIQLVPGTILGIDIAGQYQIKLDSGNLVWRNHDEIRKVLNSDADKDKDKDTYGSKAWCSHEYVMYVGMTDSFEYCKFCDLKKD